MTDIGDQMIVVTGDPISGFQFFGPFPCETDAVDWADRQFNDREWWVAVVSNPTE